MPTTLLAEEALAARANPDAAEAPSGRIEAGTELAELERRGDWVRVETPSGDHWWVDGRRLTSVVAPPEPVVAMPAAPTVAEPRRRFPRLLVAVVVLAVVVAAAGAVLLLTGSDPTTPRVLRGWFPLEAAPEIAASGELDDGIFLVSDEAVTVGGHRFAAEDFWLASGELTGLGNATAAVGFDFGVAVLTSGPAIVTLDLVGQGSIAADEAEELVEVGRAAVTVDRIALPAGDYAPAIAGFRFPDTLIVFPESGGRSSSFLSIDVETGSIEEHMLGESVEVVSAVHHAFDHLYVGHSSGVLVHTWHKDSLDGTVCEAPLNSFELGNSAVAAATLRADSLLDWVVALDRDGDALTVIDGEAGSLREVGTCHTRDPAVLGTIDLGTPVGAGARVAAGWALGSAYVLTDGGDLLIVDLDDPAEARGNRITTIRLGAEGSAGIALYSEGNTDIYHAFVADGDQLWWVAPDGPEGIDRLDIGDVEVRR